jgi:hypothetical protein
MVAVNKSPTEEIDIFQKVSWVSTRFTRPEFIGDSNLQGAETFESDKQDSK